MNELTFIPYFYQIFCQRRNFNLHKSNNITNVIEKFMMISAFWDDDIENERFGLGDIHRSSIKKLSVLFI